VLHFGALNFVETADSDQFRYFFISCIARSLNFTPLIIAWKKMNT